MRDPSTFLETANVSPGLASRVLAVSDVLVAVGGGLMIDEGDGGPVDLDEDGGRKGERRGEPGDVVLDHKPVTYHSVTRVRCSWELVQRRTTIVTKVDASGLNLKEDSEEFRSESAVKSALTHILKTGASAEISSTLTASGSVSGSYGPASGSVGASASATGTVSASDEQIEESVNDHVRTHTVVIIHYMYTVTGTMQVWEEWRVRELWDWVGEDCPAPAPEVNEYVLKGPARTLDVHTQYDVWEMFAPTLGPKGRDWAENEAKRRMRSGIQGGSWLPELPPPAGAPIPNVG